MLFLLGPRVFGVLAQAIAVILLARSVSVDAFGALNAVTGVLLLAATIFDLGISTALPRSHAAGLRAAESDLVRLNYVASAAFLISGVAVTAAIAVSGHFHAAIIILAAAAAGEKYSETYCALFIAVPRLGIANINLIIRRGSLLTVFVALEAAAVEPIWSYAFATLAAALVGTIHAHAYMRRVIPAMPPAKSLLATARAATPFLVSNVSAQVRTVDTALVGAVAGLGGAGIYAAAAKLANPILLIPSTLTSLLLPHAVHLSAKEARKLTLQVVGVFLAAGAALTAMAAACGGLVPLILGSNYRDSIPVFVILVAAVPIIGLSSSIGSILQAQGMERLVATNGLIFAVIYVAAVLAASAGFGAIGAALATLMVYAAKCTVLVVRGRRNQRGVE